jgi:hypothetical protein
MKEREILVEAMHLVTIAAFFREEKESLKILNFLEIWPSRSPYKKCWSYCDPNYIADLSWRS